MSNWLIRVALMALFTGLGISAQAKDEYHGFVKDPYYLIKGGKEVNPKDFAADPLRYLRSPAAYTALRDHVSQVVGRPMSDDAFRQLLVSDDVQVVGCVGRIKTDGITESGKVGRHERGCYPGEHLLQVKVPGGWMNLLSLGCYNPVEGERPLPPAPPPPEPSPPPKVVEAPLPPVPRTEVPAQKCSWVLQRYIVPSPGQFIHVPGLTVAVCRGQVAIPDNFVNIPGDVMTVTRQVEVCQTQPN